MAAVYCDKPNIAEREDAIESARVVVFMGCECKLKSGGREASEYDGTVYVDDVRAHASMRIGTIPHLPHRSNVVTSLSTSQENKFENILYEELPRPHRGPGKYFYNKIIAINMYAHCTDFILNLAYKLGFGEDYENWEQSNKGCDKQRKVW